MFSWGFIPFPCNQNPHKKLCMIMFIFSTVSLTENSKYLDLKWWNFLYEQNFKEIEIEYTLLTSTSISMFKVFTCNSSFRLPTDSFNSFVELTTINILENQHKLWAYVRYFLELHVLILDDTPFLVFVLDAQVLLFFLM